jgi:predicted dehydrogenase
MDRIRFGVIGIKGVGHGYIHVIGQIPQTELVAISDIDGGAVEQLGQELRVRAFTDYRAMLETGLCDAVCIATPHYLHAPMALNCLEVGAHVMVEKPIACTVKEADQMISLARRKGLTLGIGHQYRTFSTPRTMKRLIDEGRIGNIIRVLWTWINLRPEAYYDRDIWRGTWRHAGGGVLMNQTSHDLDLLCWMVGDPVEVCAMIGNRGHKAEIEDIVCANVRFANGAFGVLQLSIVNPNGYSVRQIAGDKGVLVIQDVKSLASDSEDKILLGTYDRPVWEVLRSGTMIEQGEVTWRRVDPVYGEAGHVALVRHFVKAILDGGEPLVNGEEGRKALELINAIVLSALRKKVVEFPVNRDEYQELMEALSSGQTRVPALSPVIAL